METVNTEHWRQPAGLGVGRGLSCYGPAEHTRDVLRAGERLVDIHLLSYQKQSSSIRFNTFIWKDVLGSHHCADHLPSALSPAVGRDIRYQQLWKYWSCQCKCFWLNSLWKGHVHKRTGYMETFLGWWLQNHLQSSVYYWQTFPGDMFVRSMCRIWHHSLRPYPATTEGMA